MRRTKVFGLLIFACLMVAVFGSFESNGQTLFPEEPSIEGLESKGYAIRGNSHTAVQYDYTFHTVIYTKPWEPSPWNASITLEIYQFDTNEVAFLSFPEVINMQTLMVGLKDDVTKANEPNFSWIDHSYNTSEASRSYNYMDYFYHYGSPGAELDSIDAKLDESDLISIGDYIIMADPFAVRIRISDVPAGEFASIKGSLFEYVASITEKYESVPLEEAPEPEPIEEIEVQELTVRMTYKDEHVVEAPSNNQHVIIGVFDENGTYVDSLNTITDESGVARFGYNYPTDQGYTVKVAPVLEYRLNQNDPLFFVSDAMVDSTQPITLDCGDVVINQPEDLSIWCQLEEAQILNGENHVLSAKDYLLHYNRLKLSMEYYVQTLLHTPSQELPLILVLNVPDEEDAVALFDAAEGADIYVTKTYASASSPYFPSVIFHELSHYMMYDMYDTEYPYTEGSVNHRGYINPSTADSFQEGFAFFMEQHLQKNIEKRNTAIEGPLDVNYVTWDNAGRAEPLAFASVLYDLVDGDMTSVEDDDLVDRLAIWQEIKAVNNTVGDFYEKLIENNPTSEKAIQDVFADHGFFVQSGQSIVGKGVYNYGEAFIDEGVLNNVYDPGEPFIDYYSVDENGKAYQLYDEAYSTGYAAYTAAPLRRRYVPFPGQHIKVDGGQKYFDVQVTFEDTPHLNYTTRAQKVNGKIYVHVPPESYEAVITVVPENTDKTGLELTLRSADFYDNEEAAIAAGYFYEHTFTDIPSDNIGLLDETTSGLSDEWSDVDFGIQATSFPFARMMIGVGAAIILALGTGIVFLIWKKNKEDNKEMSYSSIDIKPDSDGASMVISENQPWTCQCGAQNYHDYCIICGLERIQEIPQKQYCSNCGKAVDVTGRFCSHCGDMKAL